MKINPFQNLDVLSIGFLLLRALLILASIYILWSCSKCTHTQLEIPKTENIDKAQDQIGQTKDILYHGVQLPNENDVLQQVHDRIYQGVNDTTCPYIICQ